LDRWGCRARRRWADVRCTGGGAEGSRLISFPLADASRLPASCRPVVSSRGALHLHQANAPLSATSPSPTREGCGPRGMLHASYTLDAIFRWPAAPHHLRQWPPSIGVRCPGYPSGHINQSGRRKSHLGQSSGEAFRGFRRNRHLQSFIGTLCGERRDQLLKTARLSASVGLQDARWAEPQGEARLLGIRDRLTRESFDLLMNAGARC
jgi:hypothetical protein